MIPAERRGRLLALARNRGVVAVSTLVDELGVSEATLRRDLNELASQGLLRRTRGGALAPEALGREPTFAEKATEALEAKEAIGAAAALLVRPGESILVGPGTTTLAMARSLRDIGDLTVVTNSLLVVDALLDAPGVQIFVTGGTLRHPSRALVGPEVEESISALRVSAVFLSGNGISAARGLTTPDMLVAATDRAIVRAGERTVVLADHTKFWRETMCVTVPPDGLDVVVTDDQADQEQVKMLSDAGVEMIVAPVDVVG